MKYIAFVLGFFLIAGCAHTSTTTAPVDIVGLWKGEFNNPMGGPPTRLAFKFIRDGRSIGGVMRNESIQGEWDQLENLKIKGSRIYFTSSPKTPQGKIKIKFKGKIEGDKIRLAYKSVGGSGRVSLAIGPGGIVEVPVGKAGDPGGSEAAQKVGRGGMNDIGKGLDKGSEYSEEFTLIRVQ